MPARQQDQLTTRQQGGALASQRIRQIRLGRLAEDHLGGAFDAGDQVFHLCFGHAGHGRQGQARITAPGKTAFDFRQPALDQQSHQWLGEATSRHSRGLHACAHRGVGIRKHAQALAGQRPVGRDRLAHPCHGLFRRFRQRAQCFNRDQALDPFGAGGRDQAADAAAHRMTQQGKTLPAQCIGDIQDCVDRTDEGIVGAGRQVRAAAMAGLIDRDQVDAMQMRRQRDETGGVVQPAMQGQHARPIGLVTLVAQAGDAAQRDIDMDFMHQRQPSSRCAKAVSASACAAPAFRHGM